MVNEKGRSFEFKTESGDNKNRNRKLTSSDEISEQTDMDIVLLLIVYRAMIQARHQFFWRRTNVTRSRKVNSLFVILVFILSSTVSHCVTTCTNDISRWKEVSFSSNVPFSPLRISFAIFLFQRGSSLILLSAGRLGNNTWRLEDNTKTTREQSRGRRSRNLSIRGEERAKQSRRQLQITFERTYRFKFKFPLVF